MFKTAMSALLTLASVCGLCAVAGASWGAGPPGRLVAEWTVNTSAQFPGRLFGPGHEGCQTVWDVDGDGILEIVFGTRRGDSNRIWCFEATTRLEWVFPPIGEDGLPGQPWSKVSLVDVDSDGAYELAFTAGSNLYVLDGNGTVRWTWKDPTGSTMLGPPQAFDVDGDGYVEFFMNDNAGLVYRVNRRGELVWTWLRAGKDIQAPPTVADVDRDGEFEVLFASQDHNVYCIDAATGQGEWKLDVGANMMRNPVIVADVNGDGEYEALVWTDPPRSSVVCISFCGEELWRWVHPRNEPMRMCQAMGDVDGDGSMDMVVMSRSEAFCIDIGGESPHQVWELNFSQLSRDGLIPRGAVANAWSSYQLIADIDGDGQQEVLWLAPFPIVTDGRTGRPEVYYLNDHVALNRRQENGGWWGDVDGDGESEWIVELRGNSYIETLVYCLTLGGRCPAGSFWPEYYHCAYPGEYQRKQDWLLLKGAYSNSLWFPIGQPWSACLVLLFFLLAILKLSGPSLGRLLFNSRSVPTAGNRFLV